MSVDEMSVHVMTLDETTWSPMRSLHGLYLFSMLDLHASHLHVLQLKSSAHGGRIGNCIDTNVPRIDSG